MTTCAFPYFSDPYAYPKFAQKNFKQTPPAVGDQDEFAKAHGDGQRGIGFAAGIGTTDDEEVFGRKDQRIGSVWINGRAEGCFVS